MARRPTPPKACASARGRLAATVLGLIAALACAPTHEPAATAPDLPPAEVRASVDRAVATTGDIITYAVDIEAAADVTVELAEPGAQVAGLRIIDLGRDPPQKIGGRTRSRRWYRLRADLTGSYVLPPVVGSYQVGGGASHPLTTSEIFIEVQSVLPTDGSAHDIRDVKPLPRVQYRPRWVVPAAIAGALALVAGAAALWWRHRRRRPPPPPLPAHEVAFRALAALRRSDFTDLEAVRAYYFTISAVVRTYLEARFGLAATDMTREEIGARLALLGTLPEAQATTLLRFLNETDHVKFAGEVPTRADIAATYERALGFIDATRADRAIAPSDAGATAPTVSTASAAGASDGDDAPPTADEPTLRDVRVPTDREGPR